MMLCFEFLNRPISLQTNKINVLAIENKVYFRKIVQAMLSGNTEEVNVILSQQNQPVSFKTYARLIQNYFTLDYSAQQIKSIYADLEAFCNEEMRQETLQLSQSISEYLEKLNEAFDFDFNYDFELNLPQLFKTKNFKPEQTCKTTGEALLDYMLLLQKYSHVKCFVLLNLHTFFSAEELNDLYNAWIQRNMQVLVLESNVCSEPSMLENYTILDGDLCEIVAEQDEIGL